MTFVDAAIEVLKREGKPLPVRRLAELAIKHNLLSVVGRDPASTMQERLDDIFARHGGRHPELLKVAGDTFGLRVYPPPGSLPALPTAAAHEAGGEEKRNGDARGKRRRRRRGRKGEAPATEAGAAGDGADEGAEGEGEGEAAAATEEGAEAAPAARAGEAAPAPGERRRRRRRGGRGRRRRGEGAATPENAAAEPAGEEEEALDASEAGDVEAEGEAEAEGEVVAVEAEVVEADVVEEDEGGAADESMGANVGFEDASGGEHAEEAMEAGAPLEEEPAAVEETEGEAAAAPVEEVSEGADELLDEGMEIDGDIDHDSGPLLAPTHGTEELTRSDEDRALRPEIMGSGREDRHRRRDQHRRDRKHARPERAPREHAQKEHAQKEHAHKEHAHKEHAQREHAQKEHAHKEHAHREHAPRAEAKPGEPRGIVEAVLEVLRGGDGRPMHLRHIVEQAAKRGLLDARTPHNELVRLARVALARELREREADGLRARVRNLGGGHFGVLGSRLEPELASVETELAERAARLRDATRAALRRRLGRMSPPAFEALARALCERLGITGIELVRRGEGVAYYGGQRTSGMTTVKVLVAVRPGEAEISRRAVGELRAGLTAKGCDEGLLFAGGRPAQEALAELKAGPGVTAYDGASLAQLLVRHGLGVRRALVPVEYLDVEFLGELTE
jgi:hypothetical protein